FGWGRGGGDANVVEPRRVALLKDAPGKQRLSALRMTPEGGLVACSGAGERARRANGIENCTPFAFADEVRMGARRPEAGIIGSGNDVAAPHHLPQPLDLLKEKESQRRSAAGNDACRRV